jgi:hypothetical protein
MNMHTITRTGTRTHAHAHALTRDKWYGHGHASWTWRWTAPWMLEYRNVDKMFSLDHQFSVSLQYLVWHRHSGIMVSPVQPVTD